MTEKQPPEQLDQTELARDRYLEIAREVLGYTEEVAAEAADRAAKAFRNGGSDKPW